jgi:hypothetical protein
MYFLYFRSFRIVKNSADDARKRITSNPPELKNCGNEPENAIKRRSADNTENRRGIVFLCCQAAPLLSCNREDGESPNFENI